MTKPDGRVVRYPLWLMIIGCLAVGPGVVHADALDCRGCIDRKDIGKKQVRKKHLKSKSVTSRIVRNGSLKGRDFAAGTITAAELDPALLMGLANVVYVSPDGGEYDDPREALDGITDAGESNRYLLYIGPGTFDLGATPLVMKEYVEIRGSGRDVTRLTGALHAGSPRTQGVVVGMRNATLSDLSIHNTGGGATSVAILNRNLDGVGGIMKIERVAASASGGSAENWAIYNESASPRMFQVSAAASGPDAHNRGIYNLSASPMLTQVTALATGGVVNIGVGGDNGDLLIFDSRLEGSSVGLGVTSVSATVLNNIIVGGIAGGATWRCANTYDADLVDACPP